MDMLKLSAGPAVISRESAGEAVFKAHGVMVGTKG